MEWGKVVEKIDGVICVNCTGIYQARNLSAAFKLNSVAVCMHVCVYVPVCECIHECIRNCINCQFPWSCRLCMPLNTLWLLTVRHLNHLLRSPSALYSFLRLSLLCSPSSAASLMLSLLLPFETAREQRIISPSGAGSSS